MKCPDLHAAIRFGGSQASGAWARAVLVYYDADGEVIGKCLVRPEPPEGLTFPAPNLSVTIPSAAPLVFDPMPR